MQLPRGKTEEAEDVGRHRFSIGSWRDNYIKLLPKQPAAQSYALSPEQEGNLAVAKRFCPIPKHSSRFGLLSSLRVVGGCVIFCFLFPPSDCSFCGARCMEEKLIKLFQFHFNFSGILRCLHHHRIAIFSPALFLATKAFGE